MENNQDKNKWCLSFFAPKKPKSAQPTPDSQPPTVTNIKHEPNVIDDDNELMYPGQLMQNSMNPIKDIYQQQQQQPQQQQQQQPPVPPQPQPVTNSYDSKPTQQHSQNNCDVKVDTIKQEPPGECISLQNVPLLSHNEAKKKVFFCFWFFVLV